MSKVTAVYQAEGSSTFFQIGDRFIPLPRIAVEHRGLDWAIKSVERHAKELKYMLKHEIEDFESFKKIYEAGERSQLMDRVPAGGLFTVEFNTGASITLMIAFVRGDGNGNVDVGLININTGNRWSDDFHTLPALDVNDVGIEVDTIMFVLLSVPELKPVITDTYRNIQEYIDRSPKL